MPSDIHTGHRQRLRARFQAEGLEHFADHEVLELLLFYGRTRGDTNAIAHALLDTFGSLKGVLEADPADLMTVRGVGEEVATLLSLPVPLFRRYTACLIAEKRRLSSTEEAESYCAALLTGLRSERFYVLCLDTKGGLLGARMAAEGTLDQVPAYPRIVADIALRHNAAAVLLCHNHPSGDPTPSREDIALTHRLDRLLGEMDIALRDHIIVGAAETYSLAAHRQLHEVPSLMPQAAREDRK